MFRRGFLLGLMASLSISVVASADAGGGRRAKRPRTIEEVNQALVDRVARVELLEGKTVRRARNVRVEAEFTYWETGSGTDQVLTSQVQRISVRPENPVFMGIGIGLAAGALVGLMATGTSEDTGTVLDPVADSSAIGLSIVGGMAIGGVVGAIRGKRWGRVVFEGPLDRYLTDAGGTRNRQKEVE